MIYTRAKSHWLKKVGDKGWGRKTLVGGGRQQKHKAHQISLMQKGPHYGLLSTGCLVRKF